MASKSSAVGLGVTGMLVLTLVLVIIVVELVQVVPEDKEAQIDDRGTRPSWKQRLSTCHSFVMKAVSLRTVKTVVVVWQITIQVSPE